MPLFAMIAKDKPGTGDKRSATRPVHMQHLEAMGEKLVFAGALMGGDIATAVEEVRAIGLPVISLNMAGSVPDAADLVVSDPVQAGVMAVMAVADTAKFDLMRQLKRRY